MTMGCIGVGMAQQTQADTTAEQLQSTIADLANDVLDEHYDAYPSSSAFGADYEGPGDTPSGSYLLGRENGADGADSDVGFDYFYRRFPDPENRGQDDYEYVYGKYGWMDVNDLVDEVRLLRSLFEDAVDADYLDDSDLERLDAAVDAARGELRAERDQYDLQDLAALFRSHDVDTLRTLLAHGDEEGRVVWSLCHSKDEDGETITNPIEVPVLSEDDQFMMVRTTRYYYDEHEGGKHYAYAAVVGYDDTPERFFVHRLESDPDIRSDDTDWTPKMVRERMGFDYNLHEVDSDDLPLEERVRLQGDLAIVRRDYDVELDEYRRDTLDAAEGRALREHAGDFLEANPDVEAHDDLYITSYGHISVRADDTDGIKALQADLGIDEDDVRAEQERRDIQRLTAKRRAEIVESMVADRVLEWADANADLGRRAMKTEARQDAREAFTDVDGQVNLGMGNHVAMVSDAAEHPNRTYGDEATQGVVTVPERAELFLVHDEHEDVHLTLEPGVYEFRFLSGFEDEWWQEA